MFKVKVMCYQGGKVFIASENAPLKNMNLAEVKVSSKANVCRKMHKLTGRPKKELVSPQSQTH